MDAQEIEQPQNHQVVMNRFVAACQTDERVVAAFFGGWVSRCSRKTIMVAALILFSSLFPMVSKSNLDLAVRATSRTFTVDLTGSCSIKRASWREQCSPGTTLLQQTRPTCYTASSPGSGMTCPTTSSQRWHADSSGRRMAL